MGGSETEEMGAREGGSGRGKGEAGSGREEGRGNAGTAPAPEILRS